MGMKANPRILVINDDGIDAPGIVLLEEIARQFSDDVWLVAPDEERSGAGHSMSISHPVRVVQRDERHWAVRGTPTDCALLGIYEFMTDKKPDLILSGINRGPNLAEDITYSGTASAAMEGAVLGVPAIALSQIIRYHSEIHWDTARHYAPIVIKQLLELEWTPGLFVNVNFPDCPVGDVTGIRATTQGQRPSGCFRPVRRVDERHVPYYWVKIGFPDGGDDDGNDLHAVLDNKVSVTPLQIEMTAHEVVPKIAALFADADAAAG
ncbi:5'/3'-nucleotidase SurE [Sphingopyxis sp. JAI128]|uniref:5'/3'-nucleotidase SurE n=1 Tax=Sphingopyxis sp. JAI128 TaxID=2723066 RepID=UPI0017C10622|nr:5'/3'-nucleotidase SurE [Sphingopyxis sp. JAI128]MBB6427218.1 5'-nucleotidase [Sphingopyxis sp. JAI128]